MNEDDEQLNEYNKHPHDMAFKRIMSRNHILIPYLQNNISPVLSKRCDWEKLELLSTEFLDEHIQERTSKTSVPISKNNATNHCTNILL